MFKTIKEALSFIESQRVKRSFEEFQKIEDCYHFNVNLKNVIHVAVTNGKRSTVNIINCLNLIPLLFFVISMNLF